MTPDRLHTVCKIALYLNTNLLNKLKHSILWNIAGNTRPLGCSGEGGQPSLEWRGHLPSRQVSQTDHLSCSKWVLTSKANEWPRSLNKHVVMTFSDILSKYFSRFRRPVIATLQSLIFIFEDIFNFFDNICSLNPIPSVTDIKYFSWYLFASVHNIFFFRRRVIASLQSVIMYEYLPAFLGQAPAPYSGYKPDTHPGISHVFQSAAFR